MKDKIHPLLVVIGLAFGSIVLAISIAEGVEMGVLAQEDTGQMQAEEEMMEEEMMEEGTTEEAEAEVNDEISAQAANYYLPYPGILPDHPLYFVKMVRDRIVSWLTFDGREKVRLLELYADKRLGAAKALIEGNQGELGLETAQKAVRYQERAVEKVKKMKEEGKEVGEVANQLEKATAKHEQVLSSIEEKTAMQGQDAVGEIKERVRQNRRQVLEVLER